VSERYADATVGGFLESLAARRPAPSGGAAAALTLAMAAALTAMAARFSRSDELVGLSGPADGLRARLLELADDDAVVYAEVLAAGRDSAARAKAWRAATEVPLEMARCGVEVAGLAARLAAEGNRGRACCWPWRACGRPPSWSASTSARASWTALPSPTPAPTYARPRPPPTPRNRCPSPSAGPLRLAVIAISPHTKHMSFGADRCAL
jgi:methenyltetrahydrofolate cyclohydrolase